MRARYLNRRLAVLIDDGGKVDAEMTRYTSLTGEDRLKWVLAHELGHLLCHTADQEVAEKVGLSLRASRHPGGCGTGAPRKYPEVVVSLVNGNRIPKTMPTSAESTAHRIFDGIGVTQRWAGGSGRLLSMQFDYKAGTSVHPDALDYAVPYTKTGTRIHILYYRLGVPSESPLAGPLLDHVMAHELAHVLGYPEHSAEGVMKAKWDENDLTAMLLEPLSFSVEEAAAIRQTVDVYLNGQDASSLLLGPGKPLASRIFQKIGVRLNWRTGELPARQAAFGIRTARHAPESANGEALAASLLSGAAGVEITVYEDRLRRFLNAHPSLAGVGAGYVLVHELAHAMQGKARHSASGIMKAHWDTPDFQEMLFQKLAFTAEDVDSIHEGLAARLLGNNATATKR
jgi:hypothetical protein